ncbi:MAG: M23 family metallopeptidase [Phycisphaerales bacterium]|nr:M23 family metallopeptidase [Phycisphaerales bacterium]
MVVFLYLLLLVLIGVSINSIYLYSKVEDELIFLRNKRIHNDYKFEIAGSNYKRLMTYYHQLENNLKKIYKIIEIDYSIEKSTATLNESEKIDVLYRDLNSKSLDYVNKINFLLPIMEHFVHLKNYVPKNSPVYSRRYSSNFGIRRSPFPPYKRELHTGIDIVERYGRKVFATAAGVVEKANWAGGYGYRVVIKHKFGVRTLYAHLSKILVKPGQKIDKRHIIGLVGSTGRSTGAHLHYEVRIGKRITNPLPYLKQ